MASTPLLNDPLARFACQGCGHVRQVHRGGCAEGPCTACTTCDGYVAAESVSDSPSVLSRVVFGEGVNQPLAPRAARREKGTR